MRPWGMASIAVVDEEAVAWGNRGRQFMKGARN